jgi:hypothetical protein
MELFPAHLLRTHVECKKNNINPNGKNYQKSFQP